MSLYCDHLYNKFFAWSFSNGNHKLRRNVDDKYRLSPQTEATQQLRTCFIQQSTQLSTGLAPLAQGEPGRWIDEDVVISTSASCMLSCHPCPSTVGQAHLNFPKAVSFEHMQKVVNFDFIWLLQFPHAVNLLNFQITYFCTGGGYVL